MYNVHLRLIGKRVVDFLFVLSSEYRLKIGVFTQFQVEGIVLHQPFLLRYRISGI